MYKRQVITLEEFSDVSLASSEALDSRLRANVRRLTFRYDTRVRKENKSRDTARRQTKQNRATFGRLDDASYTVRYRALIARRRARRQIQALKVRGKKGFNAKFKVIAKTSFSTARQFTIGD